MDASEDKQQSFGVSHIENSLTTVFYGMHGMAGHSAIKISTKNAGHS